MFWETPKTAPRLRRRIWSLIVALLVAVLIAAGAFCALRLLYPYKYIGEITHYADKYGLPPALVCAVVRTESFFRPNVSSHKDASGLMQLTKGTADWGAAEIGLAGYSYDRINEPHINLELGCWYLARLMAQYGHTDVALAAYNAGSGNVSRWLRDTAYSMDGRTLYHIPFGETKRYIERVNSAEPVYRALLRLLGGIYD